MVNKMYIYVVEKPFQPDQIYKLYESSWNVKDLRVMDHNI